ncbi:MAG: hypothetical protein GXO70_08285 [Acidobacteria bacterium]|nr:hypothetical protein [Acidobacteriota bacterium]
MKRIEKSAFIFLFSAGVICALVLTVVPVAERSLEKTVRQKVVKVATGFGIALNHFQVVSIGLNSAHFRDVEIGRAGEKKLTLPDIHVFYTFNGIWKGKIETIRIEGLILHAQISRNGTVRISGLPALSTFSKQDKGKPKTAGTFPPIPDIFLENAFVFLESPYGSVLIPGNFAGRFKDNLLTFQTDIFPEGATVHGNGQLNFPKLNGTLKISWDNLSPGRWIRPFTKSNSLSVSGTVSGNAAITLTNGKFTTGSIEAETRNAKISVANTFLTLNVHGSADLAGNMPERIRLSATISSLISRNAKLAGPVAIRLEGDSLDSLLFSVPEIRFLFPIPVTASLSGTISDMMATPAIRGKYTLRIPPHATSKLFPDFPTATASIRTKGEFTGILKENLPRFTLSASVSQPLSLSLPGGKLKADSVSSSVKLAGTPGNLKFKVNILLINPRGNSGKISLQGDEITFQANGKMKKNTTILTTVNGKVTNLSMDDGIGDKLLGLSGKAHFKKDSTGNGGTFSVFQAITPDISFSDITGAWKQGKDNISFNGTAKLPVNPLALAFSGSFAPNREKEMFVLKFKLPETVLPEGTDLSPLLTSLAGFSATGNVSMTGGVSISKNENPMGTAKLNVRNMVLVSADNSMKISGIDGIIEFTDLLNLVSKPSQHATIREISAGPLKLDNGEIRFQLLNQNTVSVEAVSFNFAGGEMSFSSFLVSAARLDMDIGIYCHQLELTSLLNLAMGGDKAEGSGTVSGYVPLNIRNGNLVFGKGFLQSVPGKSGSIRIEDSKDITGGVILAEEAVKDFTYQWARVNLESKDGNLNLILQLDGKPNQKLPLIYDDKIGDFVKDPHNQRHVALQGLSLDLKFVDIDINRLLKQQGKVKFTSK